MFRDIRSVTRSSTSCYMLHYIIYIIILYYVINEGSDT